MPGNNLNEATQKILFDIYRTIEIVRSLKELDSDLLAMENRLSRRISKFIEEQIERITRYMLKQPGYSGVLQRQRIITYLNRIDNELTDMIEESLLLAYAIGSLKVRRVAERQKKRAIIKSEDELKTLILFFKSDPKVSKKIKERALDSVMRIKEEMAERILKNLEKSYREGLGIVDAALRLKEELTGREFYEVRRVARTEINGANNRGSYDTMKEMNIKYHMWITAADERVRPSIGTDFSGDRRRSDRHDKKGAQVKGVANHRRLHGEIVEVGKPFSNGLLHPHDPRGGPDEVINCRCTTRPFIPPKGTAPRPGKQQYRKSDFIKIKKE